MQQSTHELLTSPGQSMQERGNWGTRQVEQHHRFAIRIHTANVSANQTIVRMKLDLQFVVVPRRLHRGFAWLAHDRARACGPKRKVVQQHFWHQPTKQHAPDKQLCWLATPSVAVIHNRPLRLQPQEASACAERNRLCQRCSWFVAVRRVRNERVQSSVMVRRENV